MIYPASSAYIDTMLYIQKNFKDELDQIQLKIKDRADSGFFSLSLDSLKYEIPSQYNKVLGIAAWLKGKNYHVETTEWANHNTMVVSWY